MPNIPKCRYRCECVFRDSLNQCHVLNDTYFGARSCPFAKTIEQERKELQRCCERINLSWSDYIKILKNEVFDVYVFKSLFGGDK